MPIRSSSALKLAVLNAMPLSLCACGGLGNLFGGSYEGTWSGSAIGNGQTGSMQISVDQNNNVSGTDTISKPGFSPTDSGTISSNGNLTLNASYNGVVVATMSATLLVTGTSMTSTSGTISVVGGSSTQLSLNLNGTSSFRKTQP